MSERNECLDIYGDSGAGCYCVPLTYEALDRHFKCHTDYAGKPFSQSDRCKPFSLSASWRKEIDDYSKPRIIRGRDKNKLAVIMHKIEFLYPDKLNLTDEFIIALEKFYEEIQEEDFRLTKRYFPNHKAD